MVRFIKTAAAAAIATVSFASVSVASTYDDYVLRQDNQAIFGTVNGAEYFAGEVGYVDGVSGAYNGRAGAMRLKTRTDGNLWKAGMFFCTETAQTLAMGEVYPNDIAANNLPSDAYGSVYVEEVRSDLVGKTAMIGSLVANFWDDIVDAQTGVAFQLAVWELANETVGTYDLRTGTSYGQGASSASVLDLASSWAAFAAAGNGLPSVNVTFLHNANSQDLITWDGETPAPVPVPGAALLLLTGLGAFGAMRRRA